MTRRYFSNMLKEKSRRALKGDLQPSWNERRGSRMTRQSRKGDQREEKGVDELLGKVTVIRRAHRVISHKATRRRLVSRFCRNFRQSIFRHPAIYVDPPLASVSHHLHSLEPVCGSLCFNWFIFYFCVAVICLHFILTSAHVFLLLLIYFLIFFSVCLTEASVGRCSFARVSRGLIRLMDIRNWCNGTVHSTAE